MYNRLIEENEEKKGEKEWKWKDSCGGIRIKIYV